MYNYFLQKQTKPSFATCTFPKVEVPCFSRSRLRDGGSLQLRLIKVEELVLHKELRNGGILGQKAAYFHSEPHYRDGHRVWTTGGTTNL